MMFVRSVVEASRRCLAVFLGASCLAASGAVAGVVGDHGALRVNANKIVNASGTPIQIAGMSLFWPQWEGKQYYTKESVNTLVNDWGSSLVRAPMPVYTTNSDPNLQYDAKYIEDVKRIVQAAIDADIYVIIDWHLEGDQPQTELAKKFFEEMARTYGKFPNVIWEIYNEPIFWPGHNGWSGEDGGWTQIQAYAKEVLGVIRPHSSNLVIVGSGYWSSQISAPMDKPINDPNIAYSLHFYACYWDGNGNPKGRDWAAQVSRKIPLFATEWGTTKNDGTGKICLDESDKWLAMFKDNGISWAAWSFSHQGGLSAALNKGQGLFSLTENGAYLKRKIQEVGAGLRKPDTVALPGRVTAMKYASASAGLKSEPTTDVGGGWNLGYSTNGSWANYLLNVKTSGRYRLKARVASANSGSITFKWKGVGIGTLAVTSTGGWQSWKTQEIDVVLKDTGVGALVLEWSGSAQGLVNLNWLEFESAPLAVQPRFARDAFRVRSVQAGLALEYPPQITRATITNVDGQVLVRESLNPKGHSELALDRRGMVLVRFEGTSDEVVIPMQLLR